MKTETIPITSIVLDVQNPRLIEEFDSQHAALVELYLDQQNKVYPLMKHIVEHGVDPLVRVMVLADNGEYIALEGNRRICALKILSAPDILEGEISASKLADIRRLSAEFRKHPTTELDCAVADTREEADLWIQLRHTGSNNGVGVVEWGAEQKGRYVARLNQPKPIAIQILDIVHEHGKLSDEAKASTRRVTDAIRRVATDSDFQRNSGYQIVQNQIQSHHPPEEIAKVFTKLVEDLKTGVINTNDIHSKKGRLAYAKTFTPADLPDPKTANPSLTPVGSTSAGSSASKPSTPKRPTSQINRERLVQADFRISIVHKRCDKLFKEMRQLKLDSFTNTVGIILRAFLELSVDEFIANNNITVVGKPTLSNKILASAEYLEKLPTGQGMSKNQLRPIRKFAGTSNVTHSNIDTLHAYVHDRHLHPTPTDLKTHWDNIESFVKRIWE